MYHTVHKNLSSILAKGPSTQAQGVAEIGSDRQSIIPWRRRLPDPRRSSLKRKTIPERHPQA